MSDTANALLVEAYVGETFKQAGAFVEGLVRLALAPDAAKARVQEILDATDRHNQARAVAEQSAADAQAKIGEAARRIAAAEERENALATRIEVEDKRLRQAAADAAASAEGNRQRAFALNAQETAIDAKISDHQRAVSRMKEHLAA